MALRFQIFRSGTHTASDGSSRTYTDSQLANMAKVYDPAKHKAPLVLGHPKHDDPAYGWASKLEFQDGKLYAHFEDVPEEAKKLLKEGRYISGSASIYLEGNTNNPVPDSLYLKHFGLLGAQPPAIKGMERPMAYQGADDDGAVILDFTEDERFFSKLVRGLAEFMSKGTKSSDDEVIETEEEDEMTEAEKKHFEELKSRVADLDKREADLKAFQEEQANAEVKAFVEGLCSAKSPKLLPVYKDAMQKVLIALPNGEATLSYGEGDAKQTVSPRKLLMNFLESQKVVVPTKKGVTGDFTEVQEKVLKAGMPDGRVLDQDRLETHSKVLAYMEAHNAKNPTGKIDYIEALSAVAAQE